MPIIHTKSGWKYGSSGHTYKTREGAIAQMKAIKASQARQKQKVHKRVSKKGRVFKAGSRIPTAVMRKEKGFSWKHIRKKHPGINPYMDNDGDGVKNKDDCRPFDKNKQDLWFADDKTYELRLNKERVEKEIEEDKKQDEERERKLREIQEQIDELS